MRVFCIFVFWKLRSWIKWKRKLFSCLKACKLVKIPLFKNTFNSLVKIPTFILYFVFAYFCIIQSIPICSFLIHNSLNYWNDPGHNSNSYYTLSNFINIFSLFHPIQRIGIKIHEKFIRLLNIKSVLETVPETENEKKQNSEYHFCEF